MGSKMIDLESEDHKEEGQLCNDLEGISNW